MQRRQAHFRNIALGAQCAWYLITQGSQARRDDRKAQQEMLKKLGLDLEEKSRMRIWQKSSIMWRHWSVSMSTKEKVHS